MRSLSPGQMVAEGNGLRVEVVAVAARLRIIGRKSLIMPKATLPSSGVCRERWIVLGQVQGVGFRPFVFRVASELGATGSVSNHDCGAMIEVQASPERLDELHCRITTSAPKLVRIHSLSRERVPVHPAENGFRIAQSQTRSGKSASCEVTVDSALCADCLAELGDATNRRHQHALINCTNCGPRYSIVTAVPYDRPNTTMSGFEMCPDCRREYETPADRRFHAQPINCGRCGPQLELVDPQGQRIAGDPIAQSRRLLKRGSILAIKGIGGFHLAVRADCAASIDRLRRAKHRRVKPFAVMAASLEKAGELVVLGPAGIEALGSAAAPIVVARSRIECTQISQNVAPGMSRQGVMVPYTPIHYLLFAGCDLPPLVMTSANESSEPLLCANGEALIRLQGLCDAILWHDRDIARPVDDSVVIDVGDERPLMVRRARGYVPSSIELPWDAHSPGLCIGGDLKSAIAVVQGRRVILSQHLGDLSHPSTYSLMKRTVDDLTTLFRVKPAWVACDAHPGYYGTRYAQEFSSTHRVPLFRVQHHHAHAAAVLAEHGVAKRALAIVCDGTGYGEDGTTWGGEMLLVEGGHFHRVASLLPLPLAGGDAAARDARRPALAMIRQAFGDGWQNSELVRRLVPVEEDRLILSTMIDSQVACTRSSGAGRVFDGVATILGVAHENTYEAECAMRLEGLASRGRPIESETLADWVEGRTWQLDLSRLIRDIVARMQAGQAAEDLALHFHSQFSDAWTCLAIRMAEHLDVHEVGLSGGVFCNAILSKRASRSLSERGLRVLRHERLPPGDGGLAFGQAAVAVELQRL